MSIKLGTNIAALQAQRKLGETSSALGQTYERLSSGMRINRAADDAAGLAVASALQVDARVADQGVRNLNDGLSLLNIADAAVENLSAIVVRLEALATQAANGVYSPKQRRSLDAEAQALSKEYFRIARSTEFNGLNLFDGSLGEARLQAGFGLSGGIASGVGGAIGTGSFGRAVTFATGTAFPIALGDLNNDGCQDMVTTDAVANTAAVMLGRGDGSFQGRVLFMTASDPTSVALGDVNNDGLLDMVTGDMDAATGNQVSVLLGNGDGSFRTRVSSSTGLQPSGVTLGDFNGDNRLDIATSDFGSNTASVMLANGDGSFRARRSFATGTAPYWITSGDLNGDQITDLVTADRTSLQALVLLGIGDGTFRTGVGYSTGGMPKHVTLGDLNGDTVLDMVTADWSTNEVSVMLGNGNGSFRARAGFATGTTPYGSALGDLNGDGALDIISADRDSNQVGVMLGNGDGTFRRRVSYNVIHPWSVAVGDLNGDGVLDIASAGYDGSANGASALFALTVDGVSPLLPFDLTTLAGARQALPVFAQRRELLAKQRGEIGAFQARIGVAVNVLQCASDVLRTAESSIRDADIAEESSRLVRLGILQQAGAAVLAQANLQPDLAIRLLSP